MKIREVVVIAHNLRSCHNVGSLLRTAEGLGVRQVILSGYTPYPQLENDTRLPHEAMKVHKQIQKTALGAEKTQEWIHTLELAAVVEKLRNDGYAVYAVEQTDSAVRLPDFAVPDKIALILGREVEGIESEVLELCDGALEIPMQGQKESFNVVQAAAMALYHCTYM